MSETYCAKIEDGAVVQVIVCDNSDWAQATLGGAWVCTENVLVGVGWLFENGTVVSPPESISTEEAA